VALERPFGGAVAVLVGADRVAEHPVAHAEARDRPADRDDLARNVRAQDGWIRQPAVGESTVGSTTVPSSFMASWETSRG
jgi:hypothetical protein